MKHRVATGLTAALVSAAWLAPTGVHAAPGATAGKTTGTASHGTTPPGKSGDRGRAAAARGAGDFVATRPGRLQLADQDVPRQEQVYDSQGLHYVAYGRSYRGLEVVGGDFVVATDDAGRVVGAAVAPARPTRRASLTPDVSEASARRTSAAQVDGATLSDTRLVVLQDGAVSHLAYETTATGTRHGSPSRLSVYVDAHSGAVVATKEHVAYGDGQAAYSGPNPVHLDTTLSSGTYSMTTPGATTLKCQNASGNVTYTGSDDLWGNGDATNRETGCVDALYGAQQEKAMLSAWLGRNGMDGSGGWVPIRVGLADVNAYYDGTQVQVGHSQSGGRWIGSIDVVAHEFGHGIDDHTPGGISANGTQEFVADTFGAATEWYDNQASPYDTPDYTVGEEVDLVGSGPIRYMYNPSLAGDANCYSSSTPTDEVHAAAGPGNHWFYLLAEGTSPSDGQPTSPTCNGSSVTGIGIQKAMKIMYNAMLLKTSSSSYLKYRVWTLTAAKNLYGTTTCAEFNAVKAAWNAVSVPAQTGEPTCTPGGGTGTVSVTNPGNKTGTVGTAISPFTMSASGGTAPYTWSATGLPAGISISSSGTVSGTPTAAGTYAVTVSATDSTGAAGTTSFTFTISGTGGSCSGQTLVNPGFESGNTGWTASTGVIDSSTGAPAHSGSYKAWMDGYGTTHTDTLSQSVTIPSGCSATLTFWVYIASDETTTTTAYDKLTVKAGSTTLATYSNLNKGSGYVQKSISLSSLAGTTFTLTFTGTEDSSLATSFLVDDTAVTLS